MTHKTYKNRQRRNVSVAPTIWQPRMEGDHLPENPAVTLVFNGLMGFAPNVVQDLAVCEVGFHSKADNRHKHRLGIKVFERNNGDCRPILFDVPNDLKNANIELEVHDPTLSSTYFFEPGNAARREDLTNDKDFRWILDLESDYFYGATLTKKSGVYKPILTVPNALFYTLKKSGGKFRRQTPDGKDVLHLDNVAEFIAANIYLNPGGSVKLTVEGSWIEFTQTAGTSYEIQFINGCQENGSSDCTWYPFDYTDKKKRNDFYMNYQAFDIPSGKKEFYLILLEEVVNQKPDICSIKVKSNDNAPCAGAGYGGGGGGLI